jgi:transposase
MTDFLPVTLTSSLNRHRYSLEFKRQIVEESLELGTSIAAVAQTHGINANLLHKWRWCYRNGELGTASLLLSTARRHVRLPSAQQRKPTPSIQAKALATSTGHIELYVKEIRVLIHGTPDRQTLRNVIEALRL